MIHSRRHVLAAGTALGAGIVAGCFASPPTRQNDAGDPNGEPCEDIDLPLIDRPPHDPERPPPPTDPEDEAAWDDHHLGEGMDTETALAFDRLNLRFRDPPVDVTEYEGESVYAARLLEDREAFDELVRPVDDESEQRADGIDFDEELVVVVLSGFGSSSVSHQWVRVEPNCSALHLHGYYVWPYIQTADYTERVSGVVIDRPEADEIDRVWVSLTVDESKRANFATDAGLQVVDGSDADPDDGGDTANGVQATEVIPVDREGPPGWRHDTEPGIAVHLRDEEEVRAVTVDSDTVSRFIEDTDFESDTVFLIESVGPNACYRTIEIGGVDVDTTENEAIVTGEARTVDESDEDTACAEVITYPVVLLRVETDTDARTGEFLITDGWGNRETVESISVGELARE